MSLEIIGAVDLGLSIAKGVRRYVDGVKSAEHELTSAIEFLKTSQRSLDNIEKHLLGTQLRNNVFEDDVRGHITLLRAKMSAVEEKTSHLLPANNNDASSSPTDSKLRTLSRIQKAKFPVHRSKLAQLMDALEKPSAGLVTSLQMYDM